MYKQKSVLILAEISFVGGEDELVDFEWQCGTAIKPAG